MPATAPLRPALIARFVASGGTVFLVNVGLMALFTSIGLPAQLAVALSFLGGIVVHFVLNAKVVFSSPDGYHHDTRTQLARYFGLALISYGGTALGTAVLPELTGLSTFPAYLISVTFMSTAIFICLRVLVFAWRDPAHQADADQSG